MTPVFTLFLIIFLEGYVVLSTELLAIRLIVPFTGSGTDSISIIIAAVLLPLALGYFAGGKFTARRGRRRTFTVRRLLLFNLAVSAAFLTLGLSYTFLNWGYDHLVNATGWNNRILLTSLYAGLFLAVPVFLLGQTVPLVSNFFSQQKLAAFAGRILFFSTLGSFMGAIFCTLVLMAFLGVNYAAIISIGCLTVLSFLLSNRKLNAATFATTACFAAAIALNSGAAMKRYNVIKNDEYSVVQIYNLPERGVRVLDINSSHASAIKTDTKAPFAHYIKFIENHYIEPIRKSGPPRSILVLGAGGFTVGYDDTKNRYVFVDIDKDLKEISEKKFLEEPLTPNKEFIPLDARAHLNQTSEKFDLIILDLYRDANSIPESLITREFFMQVKDHLKDGGIMVGNYIGSPNFSDPFSRNMDLTLRSVFPFLNRQIITRYDGWKRESDWTNIIYSYVNNNTEDAAIYSDIKNSSMYDRPGRLAPRL